jgi:hypothetical protein
VKPLDEALVAELAALADQLDGAPEEGSEALLERFQRLSGTQVTHAELQGIYGGEEHETWVRRLLAVQQARLDPSLDRTAVVAMLQRVLDDPCDDAYLGWAFATLEHTFGVTDVSDAVFWPEHFFGADGPSEPTAEQIADAVMGGRSS